MVYGVAQSTAKAATQCSLEAPVAQKDGVCKL